MPVPDLELVADRDRSRRRTPYPEGALGARVLLGALLAWTVLSGCAGPAGITAGMSAAEVRERAGRPDARYPLPQRGPVPARERYEYGGALNQWMWLVDLDGGRVVEVRQARDPRQFAQVRPGEHDRDAVLHLLGRPYRTEHYRLSELEAWHYPYRELAWNLEMTVMFDRAGIVRRIESGPDPRFEGGLDRLP